jgi:phosphomannomutase/phosphoglucomutase
LNASRTGVRETLNRFASETSSSSGHTFIMTTLLQTGAGLGGEVSGHYFFGELGRDDALFATLLLLQILSQGRGSLADLMDMVPHYPITPDLRLPCSAEERAAILAALPAAFAGHEISYVDGVRIAFTDGWLLARPSVTEPLLTLRLEGHTEARLQEIQAEAIRRVPMLGQLMHRHTADTAPGAPGLE